jgi:cytochrome P450
MHSIAMNEKCQQKLYEEVQKYVPDFNYEDIAKMPYLEACVAETLRLYNPVFMSQRMVLCNK